MFKLQKIISGGQTGADRAALDFAIDNNVPYGGWVPKGRRTEDGRLPEKYNLQEMPTEDYSKRTLQNVLDADGTVIVSHGFLTGGSALTREFAIQYKKHWLHIDMDELPLPEAAEKLSFWLKEKEIVVLNVAGPKASKDQKVYEAVLQLLRKTFSMERII
ncbi:MAG: hypothetical protein APR62_08420 [Smithella sp. SDB]|nr:MAG: hypothetical protein APR62_08420 [Smithella sp. SDB]